MSQICKQVIQIRDGLRCPLRKGTLARHADRLYGHGKHGIVSCKHQLRQKVALLLT